MVCSATGPRQTPSPHSIDQDICPPTYATFHIGVVVTCTASITTHQQNAQHLRYPVVYVADRRLKELENTIAAFFSIVVSTKCALIRRELHFLAQAISRTVKSPTFCRPRAHRAAPPSCPLHRQHTDDCYKVNQLSRSVFAAGRARIARG